MDRVAEGEFNVPVGSDVPWTCVDGRLDEFGNRLSGPSGAGATIGIAYARLLADKEHILRGRGELDVISDTSKQA